MANFYMPFFYNSSTFKAFNKLYVDKCLKFVLFCVISHQIVNA